MKVREAEGAMLVALPTEIIEELGLSAGSSVRLSVEDRTVVVGPVRRRSKYSLEQRIADSDPRAFEQTPEDEEWFNSPPVGRELI